MEPRYAIANPNDILSPGLVVFEEILRENVSRMIAIAGDVERLRPHCKTHKMIDITRLEVGLGVVKHKCATFAEAEMLALGGARDVFSALTRSGHVRCRPQGLRSGSSGGKPAPLSCHPRCKGGAAERGAPRDRDRACIRLPAGGRGACDPHPHLPDLRAPLARVGRERRQGPGAVGGDRARSRPDVVAGLSMLRRHRSSDAGIVGQCNSWRYIHNE